MSELLGGIDEYGDEYLKDAPKRRPSVLKYKHLGLDENQPEPTASGPEESFEGLERRDPQAMRLRISQSFNQDSVVIEGQQ